MELDKKKQVIKKGYIRPSPLASLGGMIVGIIALLFGLSRIKDGGFLSVWIFACLAVIGYSLYNSLSYRGSSSEEKAPATALEVINFETDSEEEKKETPVDFDIKLRKLEKLKSDRLINEEEYQRKREEILREKW